MQTITFFLCEQMLATSVSLPLEQLRAAQSMYRAQRLKTLQRGQKKHPRLKFKLASIDGKPVKTHTGMILTPDCSITDIETSSITYLPALWRNPKPILHRNRGIKDWLNEQSEKGGIITGVGTGCCFMAEAGLLDNQPATTHWYFFEEFEKRYPKVKLKRDYFITRANNIYCAASVNSLADLTVHFIQDTYGSSIARLVERHFFHEVRQAYNQAHNHGQGGVPIHPDEDITQAQEWLNDEALLNIQIQDIAKRLGMSVRTLNRRFKKVCNTTPLQYKQKIRMKTAGELLQTSNLTIAEISDKTGYHDLAHFTDLFKRSYGTTPSQYRTTVRAKLFSAR